MIVNDETRRPQSSGQRYAGGWTALHSWIFLAIVAVGLFVIAVQNRYHYLSPAGLGKAYRIDKFFGGMQEFDPSQGWVTAQLQSMPAQTPYSMNETPGSQASHMPSPVQSGAAPPGEYSPEPSINMPTPQKEGGTSHKEAQVPSPTAQQPRAKETSEMSAEEKFNAFKHVFPNFGKDEFLLANDDLYPDWKKNVAPKGNWNEFLKTYGDFIKWWNDTGQPPESGFKLWKDFLASGKRH
jgi:hypothetical protein